jgi:hypothetical protein
MQLDRYDRHILDLLQQDGRISHSVTYVLPSSHDNQG